MLRGPQNLLNRRNTSLINNSAYEEKLLVTRGRHKPLKKANNPGYAFNVTGAELEELEDL